MNTFNNDMFASIRDALTKEKSNTGQKDILRLEAGHTYQVRLIPNVKEPDKTFYHYFNHGWKSVATGQFVSAISPTTWGERDPIAEARFKIAKSGTDEEKEKAKLLNRRENWLANVFVVSDPATPENNGKIKKLRFGRQIKKVIDDAIEGEDAAELGPRIFDLTSNGVNLKIKAEQQGDFTTFNSSRFGVPSEIPGMTPEKIKEVYSSIHDLAGTYAAKSYKELQDMVDEHYFCKDKDSKKSTKTEKSESKKATESTPAKEESKAVETEKSVEPDLDENQVAELLKGLED